MMNDNGGSENPEAYATEGSIVSATSRRRSRSLGCPLAGRQQFLHERRQVGGHTTTASIGALAPAAIGRCGAPATTATTTSTSRWGSVRGG